MHSNYINKLYTSDNSPDATKGALTVNKDVILKLVLRAQHTLQLYFGELISNLYEFVKSLTICLHPRDSYI